MEKLDGSGRQLGQTPDSCSVNLLTRFNTHTRLLLGQILQSSITLKRPILAMSDTEKIYFDDASKTYLHTMLLHILLIYICFHMLFGQLINQAGGALTGLLDVSDHTLTGNW